jgi:hypothetical protein
LQWRWSALQSVTEQQHFDRQIGQFHTACSDAKKVPGYYPQGRTSDVDQEYRR